MIKFYQNWTFLLFFLCFCVSTQLLCFWRCSGNSDKVWNDVDRYGRRTSTSIARI